MALKEFCLMLQQCANKLEEEIKFNINDVHNQVYSNKLNETKMALEKAKDYHYQEILDALGEIFKSIKKLIFHQDKIEWLSNENNFNKDELSRFSYVKRQIYNFSNTEEIPLGPKPTLKKENRRTASELSVGSLEAWEKYLDKKENEEKQIEEKVAEIKPVICKRTLSNARRRKKFVSSTLGGFLDDTERKGNLDSIIEDTSSLEGSEISLSQSMESLDRIIMDNEQCLFGEKYSDKTTNNPFLTAESKHFCNTSNIEEILKNPARNKENHTETISDYVSGHKNNIQQQKENIDVSSEIKNIIKDNMHEEEDSIKNEIEVLFNEITPHSYTTIPEHVNQESTSEMAKPKVVDVIYKKKAA